MTDSSDETCENSSTVTTGDEDMIPYEDHYEGVMMTVVTRHVRIQVLLPLEMKT